MARPSYTREKEYILCAILCSIYIFSSHSPTTTTTTDSNFFLATGVIVLCLCTTVQYKLKNFHSIRITPKNIKKCLYTNVPPPPYYYYFFFPDCLVNPICECLCVGRSSIEYLCVYMWMYVRLSSYFYFRVIDDDATYRTYQRYKTYKYTRIIHFLLPISI